LDTQTSIFSPVANYYYYIIHILRTEINRAK
jgi:hypothetical protein